jgi:DNA-directed RNA polymerase specialized sigma24 family protein
MVGVADIEVLVTDTLAGDEAAWQRLWQQVEPTLYATLQRTQVLGRLSHSEDDRRNVVVEVMARLRADRFARLARYAEARRNHPDLPFLGWLIVVAKRVAIDYMRAHDTYVDRRHDKDASTPGAWRQIGALPPDSQLPGARPPVTSRGTAHELYAFASAELAPDQRTALAAWLEGASFDDIAARGQPRDAAKLVRAALGHLRRRFREARR